MRTKILNAKDYFSFFNFSEPETGCGIEQESGSNESYFFVQTFLPKSFFNIDPTVFIFNPFLSEHELPERIQIKFELFAIGDFTGSEAFIFKPWVINIDNPMLFSLVECFHLFVPATLFYNLIERLIFLEQLNPAHFPHIRILQDLPDNSFQRFGLDRTLVKDITTENLNITRLEAPDQREISKFYLDNWEGIPNHLENKYFRPLLNTWFRISKVEQKNQWLGLKQSTQKITIGFIRLYNSNSSFTGGVSFPILRP